MEWTDDEIRQIRQEYHRAGIRAALRRAEELRPGFSTTPTNDFHVGMPEKKYGLAPDKQETLDAALDRLNKAIDAAIAFMGRTPAGRTDNADLRKRCEEAYEMNRALDAENADLRKRLEVAHDDLRRLCVFDWCDYGIGCLHVAGTQLKV